MQSPLTSFLIKCDVDGQIIEVFWHQPVTLISPFQKHLSDLFVETDHEPIREILHQALQSADVLACHKALHLRSPETAVSVCYTAIGKQILIIGMDDSFLEEDTSREQFRFIVHEFMKIIGVSSADMTGKSDMTIRLQFEQIQMLNNQLINAQRQLSRLNAETNRLNSYLNNRLVKDELTGLVSRFQYRAEIELHIREKPDMLGVFTFLDIDHFNQINDTYGHRAGDAFLRIFSNRLETVAYTNKICMRISGDEFGLYIHGFSSVEDAEIAHIWQEIETKILATPADIGPATVPIRCSAGMSIFGVDTQEIYDLIEYADFAMYKAKSRGKNTYQRFDKNQYQKEKR